MTPHTTSNAAAPIPADRCPAPSELLAAAGSLPVVLYDGACTYCTLQAERVRPLVAGRLRVAPLQEELPSLPWLDPAATHAALTLVLSDGGSVRGAEAVIEVLRRARPVLAPLLSLYRLPGVRQALDAVYRRMASRRHALGGSADGSAGCGDGGCPLP